MKGNMGYNEEWEQYDENYAKGHQKEDPKNYWEFRELLKLYKPQFNDKVLEVGCNTGEFCFLIQNEFNIEVEGIDINENAISIAKNKYNNLNFQIKDIYELEEVYDVIYMLHVIEHLEDPIGALIKLRSNLSDNGKIIITCPNKWAYILKIIAMMQKRKFGYDPTHLFEFSPYSLAKTIQKAGYKTNKIFTKPLGLPFIPRFSKYLYYNIPSFLLGGHIFAFITK